MALANSSQEDGTLRRVFISSPFSEPKGHGWNIRLRLHDLLHKDPYKPWIYEIEGKREESHSHKPPDLIIREAIRDSDVIVCFFRHRLGSWMQTAFSSGPFHGTDFEISHARQLNKPVLLYRIGNNPEPLVRGFWELFEDSRILPYAVTRVAEDEDLLTVVPRDLAECWSASSLFFHAALDPRAPT
jgi:hypothetical protein